MLRKFISASEHSEIRVLVGFALLSSFVQFFYNSVVFSLQLIFVQNCLIPLMCTFLFLSRLGQASFKKRLGAGIGFSFLIGGMIAIFDLFLGELNFYFFGAREAAAEALGQIVTPITLRSFMIGIQTRLIIWYILVFFSSLAGMLAVFLATAGNTVRKIISKRR